MAENFAFFNSVDGDRAYDADHFAAFFADIISSGVSAAGDNLAVTAAGGMNLSVSAGHAWIRGRHYYNDATLSLSLSVGGALPRIDRVVVRTDFAERKITTMVLEGTPGSTPAAPPLQRDGDCYDIALAEISVARDVISIANSAISDTRTNPDVCGIVYCLVEHIDVWDFIKNSKALFDESLEEWLRWVVEFKAQTRQDFSQVYDELLRWISEEKGNVRGEFSDLRTEQETEFRTWFDGLMATIDDNTAGNLYNLIYAHEQQRVTDDQGVHGLRVVNGGAQYLANGLWQGVAAGFAPPNVSGLRATAEVDSVSLNWTDPEDVAYQGLPLAKWKGTRVLRRDDRFPEHETDGVLVKDSTTRNAHASNALMDSGLFMDTTYYYGLFPYSDLGIVCRDAVNRLQVTTLDKKYPADLQAWTWAQVAEVSADGTASLYFDVGAEKDITLTTGETLTLQVYGFDHDAPNTITFGLKHLMAETRQMNTTNTNVGSFTNSLMYSWVTETLLPSLPSDLRSYIRPVVKQTSAGSESTTILSETMSVFLFSEVECHGSITYSATGEGKKYPIFTDNISRIKISANGAGTAREWWTRSPRIASSSHCCMVYSNGAPNIGNPINSNAVCFGFCV